MALAQQLALTYIRTKFALLSRISKKWAARQAFTLFCTPQYRNRNALPPIFEKAEPLQFQFLEYTVRGYAYTGTHMLAGSSGFLLCACALLPDLHACVFM